MQQQQQQQQHSITTMTNEKRSVSHSHILNMRRKHIDFNAILTDDSSSDSESIKTNPA